MIAKDEYLLTVFTGINYFPGSTTDKFKGWPREVIQKLITLTAFLNLTNVTFSSDHYNERSFLGVREIQLQEHRYFNFPDWGGTLEFAQDMDIFNHLGNYKVGFGMTDTEFKQLLDSIHRMVLDRFSNMEVNEEINISNSFFINIDEWRFMSKNDCGTLISRGATYLVRGGLPDCLAIGQSTCFLLGIFYGWHNSRVIDALWVDDIVKRVLKEAPIRVFTLENGQVIANSRDMDEFDSHLSNLLWNAIYEKGYIRNMNCKRILSNKMVDYDFIEVSSLRQLIK